MANPFHSTSETSDSLSSCHHLCCVVSVPFQVYVHITCTAGHVAQFVTLYTKVFMFLRKILLENNSLFEQHNDFFCS
jgi:hypothetical protein